MDLYDEIDTWEWDDDPEENCGYDDFDYGYPDECYPTEEEERQIAREEYDHNHGTCPTCGGEWGEGWAACSCSDGYYYYDMRQKINWWFKLKFWLEQSSYIIGYWCRLHLGKCPVCKKSYFIGNHDQCIPF